MFDTKGGQVVATPTVQPAAASEDAETRLAWAKCALDLGLVTQEGYDAKKAEILADF